jgi:hypothetical protein
VTVKLPVLPEEFGVDPCDWPTSEAGTEPDVLPENAAAGKFALYETPNEESTLIKRSKASPLPKAPALELLGLLLYVAANVKLEAVPAIMIEPQAAIGATVQLCVEVVDTGLSTVPPTTCMLPLETSVLIVKPGFVNVNDVQLATPAVLPPMPEIFRTGYATLTGLPNESAKLKVNVLFVS